MVSDIQEKTFEIIKSKSLSWETKQIGNKTYYMRKVCTFYVEKGHLC